MNSIAWFLCFNINCANLVKIVKYHVAIPYHIIPYHTIPYDTIRYDTIPYRLGDGGWGLCVEVAGKEGLGAGVVVIHDDQCCTA